MRMSAEELAEHLNRNSFLTSYGEECKGGRGSHKLIQKTFQWVNDELGLEDEAKHISKTFVAGKGTYPHE